MKKLLFILLSLFMITSCNPKKKKQQEEIQPVQTELILGNIVSADREYMFLNYGGDYKWFESCIVLKDYLDEEACDGTVESISNVFQIYEQGQEGADTHVILIAHTPDTTGIDVKHGFWVEDFPLNNEAISVSLKAAFDRLMETNCPKPHSRHVVLREEVGPIPCNPQYIFGNSQSQIYVDAVDGTVRLLNPAFDEFDEEFE